MVPGSMRRALARARDGKALDVAEAAVLLEARDEALEDLLRVAGAGPRPGPGRRRAARASSRTARRSSSR